MATKRNPVAGMGVKELAAKKRAAKNPARKSARSVALIGAANPIVKSPKRDANRASMTNRFAPKFRIETSLDKDSWKRYGDFYEKKYAVQAAEKLADEWLDLYIRVISI